MVKRIESLKIQNGNDNKRTIYYILHILLILSTYKHIRILYNIHIGRHEFDRIVRSHRVTTIYPQIIGHWVIICGFKVDKVQLIGQCNGFTEKKLQFGYYKTLYSNKISSRMKHGLDMPTRFLFI